MRRHFANTFGRSTNSTDRLQQPPLHTQGLSQLLTTSSEYARTHHALLTSRALSLGHRGVAEQSSRRIEEILQFLQQHLSTRRQHRFLLTQFRAPICRRTIQGRPLPAAPRFDRYSRDCNQPSLRRSGLPHYTCYRTSFHHRSHVLVLSRRWQLGRTLFSLWPPGQLSQLWRCKRLGFLIHYKRRFASERASRNT